MPWYDALLDLLYPPRCVHCARRGVLLCQGCLDQCVALEPERRVRKVADQQILEEAAGLYPFEGALRNAIHAFKYHNQQRLAQPLARLFAGEPAWRPDVLVPVPLHRERERERGYNQAALLAQALGRRWQIPVDLRLLRTRATAHQVGQTAQERSTNVSAAFAWSGQSAPAQRVLLIDDVLTTGATLLACATALQTAGAHHIRGLTLARSRA